ncbi:hypothetical protein MHIR_DE00262 [Candidatus Doolittlea endobia]|uniref:Uncharacterized protein n=1 Tax=Candidatus Doolittlea endobia TaxID=1778262 RepID=A0A143WRY3_9ENTR|nr:hypothetical protein MHIR_DE00262 [Candidatus Doolittlea endobia]
MSLLIIESNRIAAIESKKRKANGLSVSIIDAFAAFVLKQSNMINIISILHCYLVRLS